MSSCSDLLGCTEGRLTASRNTRDAKLIGHVVAHLIVFGPRRKSFWKPIAGGNSDAADIDEDKIRAVRLNELVCAVSDGRTNSLLSGKEFA